MISQDILSVCIAYEAGFGQGLAGRVLDNPYTPLSSTADAWEYGRELGAARRVRERSSGDTLQMRLRSGAEACQLGARRHGGTEAGRMFGALDSTLSEAAEKISELSRCACGLSIPHAYNLGRCTPGWKI